MENQIKLKVERIVNGQNGYKGQKGGDLCPRCGLNVLREKLVQNALSRYTDVYICSDCGREEALIDSQEKSRSKILSNWFVLNN